MSSSNCCFLTCIQISQEAGQVVWYSHLFQSFPQFIVIHTVKGFGRHSTRDKGHEEGGSAYAKVGSSLRSPPGYSRASTPQKTRVCLLYCFVLSPLTLLGAVPHHHLALSVKELTRSESTRLNSSH